MVKKKTPTKTKAKKKPPKMTEADFIICHAQLKNPGWSMARCYRVGHTRVKETTAWNKGHLFFKRPHIKKYMDDFRKKMINDTEITIEYVLSGIARTLDFNAQNLLDKNGQPKPLKDIDPEDVKVMEGIKLRYMETGTDSKGNPIYETFIDKYKKSKHSTMYDLLGKYLKMWSDGANLNLNVKNRKFELVFTDEKAPEPKND